MKLTFLGVGSASNVSFGNTAAYFIDGDALFLINCGESVFETILDVELLSQVKEVYCMITSTRSDQCGSLGSLVRYCKNEAKIPFHLVCPENAILLQDLMQLLRIFDCPIGDYCDTMEPAELGERFTKFERLSFIHKPHIRKPNYALRFATDDGIVFYSGDECTIEMLQELIMFPDVIERIYVETTLRDCPGKKQLSLKQLNMAIPSELRPRVFCMYVDSEECAKRAVELGFQIAAECR